MNRGITSQAIGLVLAGLAAGCAEKPIGCADPRVLDRISEAIPRDGIKHAEGQIGSATSEDAERARNLLVTFGKSLKVQVKNIASEGFDAGAKKYRCTADLHIASVLGPFTPRRMTYTVQGMLDGKDFLINIPEYEIVINHVYSGYVLYQLQEITKKAP